MARGPDGHMTNITQRIGLVTIVILFVLSGAFLLESVLGWQAGRAFGHSQAGHILGWTGLALILVVFAYPAQRWTHPNRMWSKGGLFIHEGFGILGPLFILVHSGAHFHALVPVLTVSVLGLVVVSGIVGEFLHAAAFRGLYEQRHKLAAEGLSVVEIDKRLKELASQEGILRWWPWIHVPLTAAFAVLTVLHVVGALYFGGM